MLVRLYEAKRIRSSLWPVNISSRNFVVQGFCIVEMMARKEYNHEGHEEHEEKNNRYPTQWGFVVKKMN
jgi:hypothetical protein